MQITQLIEAVLFSSDAPLSAADVARIDESLDEDSVVRAVEDLRADYDESERSFQIYEVGGGYQILTRPEYAPHLERFDTVPQPSRLSTPALEVLAIVAYRQPIGRTEIEEIRGVGSSAVLRTLQDRGLIEVVGRGEGLGRPLLYGTAKMFLEHFGFRTVEDLPRPEELPIILREGPPPREEVDEGPAEAGADASGPERPLEAAEAPPPAEPQGDGDPGDPELFEGESGAEDDVAQPQPDGDPREVPSGADEGEPDERPLAG